MVENEGLTGNAWSAKFGWVTLGNESGPPYSNTSYADYGVNNDSQGNLSGYGWGENVGWLNFSSGNYPERVVIDEDGNFSGYARSEKAGWVNFSSLGDVNYRVKTSWQATTPTPSVTPTSAPTATPTPTVIPTPSVTPTMNPTPSVPPTPVPTATPEGGCGINLVLYLHGYLNETTFTQQTATVNLQFRTVRNLESGIDYNLALDQNGATGSQSLPGLSANSYYLLIRHKLFGNTYSGSPIPLGSNHFPAISKDAISFSEGETRSVNFSDQCDSDYVEVYVSPHPQACSPMIAVGTSGRYWQLGGGDADGNQTINVSDILKWDTLVGFNDSDDRGDPKFSDQGNFNGSDQIEGYDFNVWKKMINEGNTYAPLP